MFKPFYFHYNKGPGKLKNNKLPRGFTFYVEPDVVEENKCVIKYTLCNPKDEFNKKLGRYNALNSEKEYIISKKQFPNVVDDLVSLVNTGTCDNSTEKNKYNYLLKHFL